MEVKFTVEFASTRFEDLLRFIARYYLRPKRAINRIVHRRVNGVNTLYFRTLYGRKGWVDVIVYAKQPVLVEMFSTSDVPEGFLIGIKEDIIYQIKLFEEQIRKTSLYFTYAPDKSLLPTRKRQKKESFLNNLFFGNMLTLILIFVLVSFTMYWISVLLGLAFFAPILIIGVQFGIILVSDKIVARFGDWIITQENPELHILQYHLPFEEYRALVKREDVLIDIRQKIFQRTIAIGDEINCRAAKEVFSEYRIPCVEENFTVKKINLYEIVKMAAEKFNLPLPKIVVADTLVPNAAAIGSGPDSGVIMITTGIMTQLEENELLNVIGHELSHLKNRDPLVLFGLFGTEFLLRVYIFFPFIIIFPLIYLLFVFSSLFFVGKFLEARSDLESAIKIGQPAVMANALRKIGYRRLHYERIPSHRIMEWIGFDPHPPMYFRISRLEKLKEPVRVSYPLIRSIKDCIIGFFEALKL
ncbi:MAG: M48 family metalloprotease [Candidatus Hydrothermarchaeota archaeon]